MDINNLMRNMQEVSAKREMQSTEWLRSLDAVLDAVENLVKTAGDEKQLDQLARAGSEITRVAKLQKERMLEDDEDFDEWEDEE